MVVEFISTGGLEERLRKEKRPRSRQLEKRDLIDHLRYWDKGLGRRGFSFRQAYFCADLSTFRLRNGYLYTPGIFEVASFPELLGRLLLLEELADIRGLGAAISVSYHRKEGNAIKEMVSIEVYEERGMYHYEISNLPKKEI